MRLMTIACVLIASSLVAQEANPARDLSDADRSTERRHVLVVPAGTKVPLVLKQGISTKNARVGDPVFAVTSFPVAINDRIAIPSGTYVQGEITEVRRGGRVHGRAEVLLHFRTLIFPSGYTVSLPGALEAAPDSMNTQVKDSEGKVQADGQNGQKAGTVAKTAGTGAAIGGLSTGSIKGAAIGGGIGSAVGLATAMLTRGNDVRLESGTTVDMVFERSVTLDASKLLSTR